MSYHSAYGSDKGRVMKIPHCAFSNRQTTLSVCRIQSSILSSLPPHAHRTLCGSRKPYPLSSLVIQAFEEGPDERCDLIGRFVEGEMPSFEEMDFRAWNIVGIGCRAGDRERGVVFSPNHQHWWLCFAKPVLPTRLRGDVGPVIQKQRGLDVCLAWTSEKYVLVRPCIGIVAIGMWTGADVALARRFEGREVGLEVLEFAVRICPIFLACLPKRAQPLFMRDRVLNDDGANALWIAERHAKTDRPAIILHEQNVVRDP